MRRIKLVVYDHDRHYLEMITHYIRTSDFAQRISIRTFSAKDSFEQDNNILQDADILLAGSDLASVETLQESPCYRLILSEYFITTQLEDHCIFKYQPIQQLLNSILCKYKKSHGKIQLDKGEGESQTQTIAFYSGNGGAGKTVVSLLLANQFALQNKQVLLLNFETISAIPAILSHVDEPSPLVYWLKTNTTTIQEKIRNMLKVDPESNIHYLELQSNPLELMELNAADMILLLDTLVSLRQFDYIFVDLDTSLQEKVWQCMRMCDQLIWLLTDDVQSVYKTERALQLLKQLHPEQHAFIFAKINFILNKHLGSVRNESAMENYHISGYLPYIPEWKSSTTFEQFMSYHRFNEQLMKLGASIGFSEHSEGVPAT